MTTTIPAKVKTIRIALPVADGRLHGHFGGCREFVFVDADTESLTVFANQMIPAPPHQPGLFPHWLREHGVHVVIAGGIGKRALDNFARHGIAVHAGEPNARIETLVAFYLAGLLTGSPAGCEHHGHIHEYAEGHHHHENES